MRVANAALMAFAHHGHDVLAAAGRIRHVTASSRAPGSAAAFALDGRVDTAWMGEPGAGPWSWSVALSAPTHVAVLRAKFGAGPSRGVPTTYAWEVSRPDAAGRCGSEIFTPLEATREDGDQNALALPTRRSWFVGEGVWACALRLSVRAANGGSPPVLAEVAAIEGASNVLATALASSEDGVNAAGASDGAYATSFVGTAGRGQWTLSFELPTPAVLDRVRLVLGEDATSRPRSNGVGRRYGVARMPLRARIETSPDGTTFQSAAELDGLPVRRRLLSFSARTVRVVRLVMEGATKDDGALEPSSYPVVREVAAYAAQDHAPVLAQPSVLSVNANPSGESHDHGGELANDVYWTKFLQRRFSAVIPALREDDRYARMMGPTGALLPAERTAHAGEVLESIEGDDPTLEGALLAGSTPRPIVVLSGSNDWDYARATGPLTHKPKDARWRWDPLGDAARSGGMGQLATAVHHRVAPFLGFCGGAQILTLLEVRGAQVAAHPKATFSSWDDAAKIDATLRRTNGRPIRGFSPPDALLRSWPGDSRPREEVTFAARDPLFADLAGTAHRSVTHAFPEWHAVVVRPSAFLAGGPLAHFEVLATSDFCGPKVVPAGPLDPATIDPDDPKGKSRCLKVPEVFRSEEPGSFPVIGAQFHAEQTDFPVAASGDPPESVADARLFFAAAYESIVDAYLRLAR